MTQELTEREMDYVRVIALYHIRTWTNEEVEIVREMGRVYGSIRCISDKLYPKHIAAYAAQLEKLLRDP